MTTSADTPATTRDPSTITFREAYARLEQIAQHLRQQESPDIDALIPMVGEALQMRSICLERIQAAQAALEQMMPEAQLR